MYVLFFMGRNMGKRLKPEVEKTLCLPRNGT